MKIELILENKNWFTFRLVDFKNDFIVVINKKSYFNPQEYNSVIGRYFSNGSDERNGLDVENGSLLKETIDSYFELRNNIK